MNRSLVFGGLGVLAIAALVGLFLFFQLPSPDQPAERAAREPAAPAEDPAAEEPAARPVPPDFDIVRVDNDGNVVIAGRATPGCTIVVRDGEHEVGRTTVDRKGEWVLVPDEPLAPGERQLVLAAECAGGAPVEADRVVAVVVPERDGGRSGALALAVPREGDGETEVLQTPGGGGNSTVAVGRADYDDQGNVTLSGRAPPGAEIQVYLDNEPIGTARADAGGRWTLKLDRPVPPGGYNLRVDQIGPDGRVVARVEIPFVRGEPLDDFPAGRIVVIQPGDHLWKIARDRYGSGVEYSLIYEANRNQIRDPDLIFPGQVFTLPQVN